MTDRVADIETGTLGEREREAERKRDRERRTDRQRHMLKYLPIHTSLLAQMDRKKQPIDEE